MSQHAHRSSFSQASRSTSQINSTELSDDEILRNINELKFQIRILHLENEVLEKVILRLDPTLMTGVQQAVEYGMKMQSASMNSGIFSFVRSQSSKFGLESMASPSRVLISPSKISARKIESSAKLGGTVISGGGPKINIVEKSDLVTQETEILGRELEKNQKKADAQRALLKAQQEEVSTRVVDAKKASTLFQKQVIEEGYDKIAQRITAEAWIRFMADWVKMTDDAIGKLRLRTSTLNAQYVKFKKEIKVKAELNDKLRPVDFEKVQIENDQCLAEIRNKLIQLEELKKVAGCANLKLTVHKKAMIKQNNYLDSLKKTIALKRRQQKYVEKESGSIAVEVETLDKKYGEVKKTRIKYLVPDVMKYVAVRSELTDLKHTIKVLTNRLHIQNIALKSMNNRLLSLQSGL